MEINEAQHVEIFHPATARSSIKRDAMQLQRGQQRQTFINDF